MMKHITNIGKGSMDSRQNQLIITFQGLFGMWQLTPNNLANYFASNTFQPNTVFPIASIHKICNRLDSEEKEIFYMYLKGYTVNYICTKKRTTRTIVINKLSTHIENAKNLL